MTTNTPAPAIRAARLRAIADRTIGPIDGGYLRPWMCQGDPASAHVLLIGANPATAFPETAVPREEYLDMLVEGGDRLRALYESVREGDISPTRRNIERVVGIFAGAGVGPVLETNVWTLPARRIAELRRADPEVVARSTILLELIETLSPRVLIVHGAAATDGLAGVLGRTIGRPSRADPIRWSEGSPTIVATLSLSPPPANGWLPAAGARLRSMADRIAEHGRQRAARFESGVAEPPR